MGTEQAGQEQARATPRNQWWKICRLSATPKTLGKTVTNHRLFSKVNTFVLSSSSVALATSSFIYLIFYSFHCWSNALCLWTLSTWVAMFPAWPVGCKAASHSLIYALILINFHSLEIRIYYRFRLTSLIGFLSSPSAWSPLDHRT